MKIFGAGLSGLIAAIANPKARVFERNDNDFQGHHALLRFRSMAVSDITGIKFKKVKVIKSIWSEGKECQPTPRLVALYSMKNTGCFENRSIMDIDTVERYIAPDNFHQLLVKECEDRISFNYELKESDFIKDEKHMFLREDIISTLPLSINAKMLGYDFDTERNKSIIYVNKFKIENCDMYSTVYFPDEATSVYRASLTGNSLIIESKASVNIIDVQLVMRSMGLFGASVDEVLTNHVQPMGKLSKVNDSERRVMIYKMSHDHGVFSLGRFALHKNILLDDVAHDIRVIKDMMQDDSYGVSIKGRA
jgi:hypothetical protein